MQQNIPRRIFVFYGPTTAAQWPRGWERIESESESLLPQSWCRHSNRSNWRRVCGTFGWRLFRGWRRSASILVVKSALVVVVVLMVVVTFIINGTVIISDKQSVYYHFIFVLGQTFALISYSLRSYLWSFIFIFPSSTGGADHRRAQKLFFRMNPAAIFLAITRYMLTP